MIIPRDNYLQRLIRCRNNGLIKTITGIRRCGKSVLLSKLFYDWLLKNGVAENHIIYIAFDDMSKEKLKNPHEFLDFVNNQISGKGMYYILLDEVQMMDNFVGVLLSLLHKSNCDIYVTGSNSKFLSTDIVTEFRGRSQEIHMQPLTFAEYYNAVGGDKHDAWQQYYLYGGLPQLLSLSGDEDKANYLSNLYRTVYLSDLIERNNINNDDGLETLIRVLASSIGAPSNPSRISSTFLSVEKKKISANTLTRYIKYLQEAFVISEALRFDVKGRKYIGTETKYYFSDIGIRNSILGFRQVEENHAMENILYNELRYRGFNVDVGMVEVREKNGEEKIARKRLEVDFVANKGSKRYYVQSAFRMDDAEKVAHEKKSLQNIPDSFRKILVEKDHIAPYHDEDGFLRIGLFDFLLKPDSLDI
ncbi:MAG: ATP-binding protein [Clostridiaceae bacterium]|nr:ATP-binding protein [Clostridiaceae bacterium]